MGVTVVTGPKEYLVWELNGGSSVMSLTVSVTTAFPSSLLG